MIGFRLAGIGECMEKRLFEGKNGGPDRMSVKMGGIGALVDMQVPERELYNLMEVGGIYKIDARPMAAYNGGTTFGISSVVDVNADEPPSPNGTGKPTKNRVTATS